MISKLLFNIKYELNELRYSTELPIVIIAWSILGYIIYTLIGAIL